MRNKAQLLWTLILVTFILIPALARFRVVNAGQNDLDPTRRPPHKKMENTPQNPAHPMAIDDCYDIETGLKECRLILSGFQNGHFDHPGMNDFVKRVVRAIEGYETSESHVPVLRINIQGFADGTPNSGVSNWRDVPFKDCKEKTEGKLDDIALATVRGCVVKQQILKLIGDHPLVRNNANELPPVDFPDRFNVGEEYRKVEVIFRAVSDKSE